MGWHHHSCRRDGTTTASELLARKVVVSTGSKARRLKGIPFEQAGFYDSDSIGAAQQTQQLVCARHRNHCLGVRHDLCRDGRSGQRCCPRQRDDLLPMLDGAMRDALISDLEAKGVEILISQRQILARG